MRLLWVLAAVVALFVAYVVGRAVGILLGVGPYATEAIAIVVVLVLIGRAATRRSGVARPNERR